MKTKLSVRTYGSSGPFLIVLHGGPGAPGYMAPLARKLAGCFQVLEPFQRVSDHESLTVSLHVSDLHEIVETYCGNSPPAIVGHSWGAMLALAYAAAHPKHARLLALIGCGTFDIDARKQFKKTCEQRMNESFEKSLNRLSEEYTDPNEKLKAMGALIRRIDSFDLINHKDETEICDAKGHEETWSDMLRLQEDGKYPSAFEAIQSPAILLHGAYDPHPGQLILNSLKFYMPHLEYHEWERCGHYPWLEKSIMADFYEFLQNWIIGHLP